MEMNGRLIVKCDKTHTAQYVELVEAHCEVDETIYKKGILHIFVNGGYDLIEEVNNAIKTLSCSISEPILGWIEDDEEPCVTLLTSTSEHEVLCNKLDSALYEYLEDFEDEEDDDECKLSEEHQLALKLGPKKYFTQQYETWIAPYKKDVAQKDFKDTLKEIIENY